MIDNIDSRLDGKLPTTPQQVVNDGILLKIFRKDDVSNVATACADVDAVDATTHLALRIEIDANLVAFLQ